MLQERQTQTLMAAWTRQDLPECKRSVPRRIRASTDRRLSGVQYLPLSAAKPGYKALMVCQPIDGHHGATVRGSTAVSGRRPNFPTCTTGENGSFLHHPTPDDAAIMR